MEKKIGEKAETDDDVIVSILPNSFFVFSDNSSVEDRYEVKVVVVITDGSVVADEAGNRIE